DKTGFFAFEPLHLLAFELLKSYGFSEDVCDELIAQKDAQPGTQFLSPQYQLAIDRDQLILTPRNAPAPESVIFNREDIDVRYAHFTIRKSVHTTQPAAANNFLANEEKLVYPLTIRPWQHGDSFNPTGLHGSKKLSDYFTDQKIPLAKKAQIPLLVNGDGCIIWVCGYRGDRRFSADASSRKVVIFELSEHHL
ncbi:MAG: tRNA lysidine(34) synthetase TilS, partial [Mucilaginibacter polytrichastri]|nr:tRNA lysidine(34) synthetase TilS [Mucilaginibacter polytrichastri]